MCLNSGTVADPFLHSSRYYYDTETGFYYVSSRYYDPEVGRFISADTTDILGVDSDLYDKNLYAYCDNNPVMRKDTGGELWVSLAIGAGVGIATQLIADFGIGLASGSSLTEIASSLSPVDYVSAAFGGALAATGINTKGAVVANAFLGGTTYLANCSYRGVDINAGELLASTVIGTFSGRVGGSGVNGKNLRGIYKYSSQVLKTTRSPRKSAMYTAKQTAAKKTAVIGGARTFAAGVVSNVLNFFRKIFTGSVA